MQQPWYFFLLSSPNPWLATYTCTCTRIMYIHNDHKCFFNILFFSLFISAVFCAENAPTLPQQVCMYIHTVESKCIVQTH